MRLDISFDFRCDSAGKDPDIFSPTLRQYHQNLWSKKLPCGLNFQLDYAPNAYLHHSSDLGNFTLTSDSAVPTYTRWKSMQHIVGCFSEEENERFRSLSYTIGGMIIFPGNRVHGKQTINGARGFNRQIADRLDLTLECIRLFYIGENNPLMETLLRYKNFFDLFNDFRGYVEFFLLHDLVQDGYKNIKFFLPFDNFSLPSVPQNIDNYIEYKNKSIDFVIARNNRIHSLVNY